MGIIKQFLKTYRIFIFIGILIIIGMNGCSTYNKLSSMNEDVNNKWSQVQNVYQRRTDLIPNFVEAVKGYTEHEKSTLTDVISARAKATSINIDASKLNADNIKQFEAAQGGLSQALSKLMVVSEKYPDLKANESFKDLMTELAGTENRIAIERKGFNDSVKDYNKKLVVLPAKLWASMFGFEKRVYFEAEAGSDKAPKIKFTKD